jgi:MFS family permease
MRYRELFAESEFTALFTADVLSISGTYLARVAVAGLVYHETRSAALTGVAFAISYLPYVFSPWLASLADVFPRRVLLIVCDVARAACIAGILIPGVGLRLILALLFLEAVWRIPWGAARLALLSDILTDGRFPAGNALVASARQALQVGGFAVGGVVVALAGVRTTLAIDVASYLVSALIVAVFVRRRPAAWETPPQPVAETEAATSTARHASAARHVGTPRAMSTASIASTARHASTAGAAPMRMPTSTTAAAHADRSGVVAGREVASPPAAKRPGTWEATREGLRTVVRTPRMRRLFALLGLGPAMAVITEGLAVPFADQLGGDVTLAGLIMAAPPLGTVAGLFVLGRLPLATQCRLVTPLAVGCGLTIVLTGFAAALPAARVVVLVILVLSGVCVAYISAVQSEISALVPTLARGRVFGLANATMQVSQGAAIVLAGLVASSTRVSFALVVLAAVGTAAIVMALLMRPRMYVRFDPQLST